MKKIYIIMAELPTISNRFVRLLNGISYSHLAISLDKNLKKRYAFQVQNKRTPLVGGFLEENESYYFHNKKNCFLKEIIFEIPVTNEEYYQIEKFIQTIKKDKEYIFNYISCLFMFFTGGLKAYKAYNCTEFIGHILEYIDEIKLPKKPHKLTPKEIYHILGRYKHTNRIIYSEDYNLNKNDIFLKDIKLSIRIKKSFFSVKESIHRYFFQKCSRNYQYEKIYFNKKDCKE